HDVQWAPVVAVLGHLIHRLLSLFPYTTPFRSVRFRGSIHPGCPHLKGGPGGGHRLLGLGLRLWSGHVREKCRERGRGRPVPVPADRKSTRLNSSHVSTSYAVFCLKTKSIRTDG